MDLLGIGLYGFRLFDEFEFKFPTAPGLYLLTGENRDHPKLGSNGCGKTSMWDAICWAIYGSTTQGLRGPELLGEGVKRMRVEVDLDAEMITREAGGSKQQLFLGTAEVDQPAVDKLVALTQEQFLTTVIVPQAQPLFAELKPVEQVGMLESLLNLQRWTTNYAKRATALLNDQILSISRLDGAISSVTAQLQRFDIENLRVSVATWERKHQEQVQSAEEQLKPFRKYLEPVQEDDARELREQAQGLQSRIKRYETSYAILERQEIVHRDKVANAQAQIAGLTRELATFEQRKKFFTTTPKCHTCDQAITPRYSKKVADELDAAMAALEVEKVAWEKVILDATADVGATVESRKDVLQKRSTAERELNTVNQQLLNVEQARRFNQQTAARFKQQLDRVTAEENPYIELLAAAEAQHAQLEAELKDLQTKKVHAELLQQHAKTWGAGFRSIRSQMVSDALSQFELEIEATLEDLGLIGWSVRPKVDPKVFESERVASGFGFDVTDPTGKERDLRAYSGGELQRVKLAIQLGLGAMVEQLTNTSWNFEVWDEPSQFLSEEGIQGLFASLQGRAQRLSKKIFIVDHHSVNYSELTGVYRFIREGGKVRLES